MFKTVVRIFFLLNLFLNIVSCPTNYNENKVESNKIFYSLELDKLELLKLKSLPLKQQNSLPIVRKASQLLQTDPISIIDKSKPGPSGNFQDYYSISPYWWPNTQTYDGLPYVRIDGFRNPEVDDYDRIKLIKLKERILTLGIAYYITNNEDFASAAIDQINIWFINSETSMTPHLFYAQAIPGETEGRALGIIESRDFVFILDAVKMLSTSTNWSNDIESSLKDWFSKYLNWLWTHPRGETEKNQINNHATWYDLQVAAFAEFTENDEILHSVLNGFAEYRIETQIDETGKQPFEMRRADGMQYSVFNLQAMLMMTHIGDRNGFDYWNYPLAHKSKLEKAINYITDTNNTLSIKETSREETLDDCSLAPILYNVYLYNRNYSLKIKYQNINLSNCSEFYFIPERL